MLKGSRLCGKVRYEVRGDPLSEFVSSPNKHRHFCSNCGSPIYSHGEKTRHVVSVRCGTLDTVPGVRPTIHFYVADKAAWTEICDGLPQVAESLS